MKFLSLVASFLCFQIVLSSQTYRAAIINPKAGDIQLYDYAALINEAGKANVDLLVLPSSLSDASQDVYEEAIKTISDAVKKSGIYVIAHIFERSHCNEPVRSNVVFDRQGSIVSIYRKPFEDLNRNTTATSIGVFTTDFGVTFGNLMEDDLLLHNLEETNLKNFVLTGKFSANGILKNPHFSWSWSFVAKANLVTSDFIFGGRSARRNIGDLIVAELEDEGNSQGGDYSISFPAMPIENQLPDEDLSQYIIRPLNLEASEGHNETVCHGNLCCHFNIKATLAGQNEMNFGLIVFNGLRHFHQHNIGVQYCGVRACAYVAQYKKSCHFRSQNSTFVKFDRISIGGNFSKVNSSLFPTIISFHTISPQQFNFEKKPNAYVSLINAKDLFAFGVLGRDYSVDSTDYNVVAQSTMSDTDYYVYIYNEDMQQFIDYVWIRLRILLFVVSIYVLEMM